MKIVLFNPYDSAGGGKEASASLSEILRAHPKSSFVEIGVESSGVTGISCIRYVRGVISYMRSNRDSIYVVQGFLNMYSFCNLIALWLLDARYIAVPRGDYVPPLSRLFITSNFFFKRVNWAVSKLTISGAYMLICSSYTELHHLIRMGAKTKYRFVVPDSLNVASAVHYSPFPSDVSPTALYLGRSSREKNLNFLLDLWPSVLEKLPTARLLLIGPDGLLKHCGNFIGKNNSISVIPWISEGDANHYISRASCVVLPSLNESFGLTISKSLYFNTFFIASEYTPWQHVPPNRGLTLPLDRDLWIIHLTRVLGNNRSSQAPDWEDDCYSIKKVTRQWHSILEFIRDNP